MQKIEELPLYKKKQTFIIISYDNNRCNKQKVSNDFSSKNTTY